MLHYQIIPVTHYQQNCSLVWCDASNKAALIDPGGDVEQLLTAVQSRGLTLEKIILTHGHLDHVGGTAELIERLGLPVEGPHRDDMFWIGMLDQQAQMMGFQPVEGFTPNIFFDQGDTVSVGNEVLHVRFTPGHTPGHVVLYHADSKMVWVGDVLFKGSVGRTDFPRGDFDTLAASIRRELWSLPDDTTFVPGHGPLGTIGEEKVSNPFVAGAAG